MVALTGPLNVQFTPGATLSSHSFVMSSIVSLPAWAELVFSVYLPHKGCLAMEQQGKLALNKIRNPHDLINI